MAQGRFSPRLVTGIVIALVFSVALSLRIALPYEQVFAGDWIKFTGIDAYYHMRLVDNLLHHFPHYVTFDPYTFYPHGTIVAWPPFFDWLLAGIIWLVGLAQPSQHTADVVGVYFPAVLGTLTVIPVYFIGRELFGRWAGVLSASLLAVLPGEFLGRSILGFTDHHAAEVLFSVTAMLFLVLAVKTAKQKQLSFNHLKRHDWAVLTKPLIHSLLAGVFLGIYLLTWAGGLLFVFLIFSYFIIQFIIDHLRGKPTHYLAIVGTLSLLTASVVSLPLLPQTWLSPLYLPSLAIAVLAPVILASLSSLMESRGLNRAYYPLILVGVGLAGLAIFYAISPSLLKAIVARFSIFTPAGAALTITEVEPLLFPKGSFSLSVAWGNFTTGFFLSFISLGILIYSISKRGEADKLLFITWSLVMLAATLGQRRFAYYFTINVALLTGYLSWLILEFAGFKKAVVESVRSPEKVKKKTKAKRGREGGLCLTASWVKMALAVPVVFFLSFFPNIGPAMNTASHPVSAPHDAWCESLSWLKDNTPDPFGNPDFYYDIYEPPQPGEAYEYPDSAYGVMAWWDYGHWITRIAHRIPISNPFQQGGSQAAHFFTAQDETSANKIMDKLGSRYVVIDYATATIKFHVMPTFVGSNEEKFCEFYYQRRANKLVPVLLFYPEYYRSLAVRLYNFDAKSVTPKDVKVISYQKRISREGVLYKEIASSESFSSYEAAITYISGQKSGNYEIVGTNPFIGLVPLDELEHYKLIYSSDSSVKLLGGGTIPAVKIFEYVK